jgi:hypothetical protein
MIIQRWQEAVPLPTIRAAHIVAVIIFLSILEIFSQQLIFAQVTQEDFLTVEVSREGDAKITQGITPSTTVSRIAVKPITQDISNILAIDENNVVLSFSDSGGVITIDTLGSANVTLTYNANDIVSKATPDIWELDYNSSGIQSTIVLPKMSEIIYVNDIPIDIVENVVTMPTGEVSVRYKIKSVDSKNFMVAWEEKKYIVQVVTASDVQDFGFEQSSKSIGMTLDTSLATLVIIPKSLIGGPYTVTSPSGQPVDFRQYYQNSSHSWIRVEPNEMNSIRIVGTTVVPEFPFLPLSAGLAVFIVLLLSILNKRAILWRH